MSFVDVKSYLFIWTSMITEEISSLTRLKTKVGP